MKTLLDNDLYKFTMMQAVLERFPNVRVQYKFKNRDPDMQLNKAAIEHFFRELESWADITLTEREYNYLKRLPYFKPQFLEYLKNFRFNPHLIQRIDNGDGDGFDFTIAGSWAETILFEVPLLALISESYFAYVDTDWSYDGQAELAQDKAERLSEACSYADFGTRRRRSYEAQRLVVENMKNYKGFVGTSNVHLAMMNNVRPIGTMAHEWIMGLSVLRSLRHANRDALYEWINVYDANLGIALTDTFGTDAFFKDFDLRLAKTYDGVRHDSDDPVKFAKKTIAHYKKLGIDPSTKTIVFSDSLNVDKAIFLAGWCKNAGIRSSYGIGTFLTNDFKNSKGTTSKPMNIVIKLSSCEGIPVVKLGDGEGKETGDEDAVRVVKWIHQQKALDRE